MLTPLAVCTTLLLLGAGSELQTTSKDTSAASKQAPTAATEVDLLPVEQNIVNYTNAERAKYGLAALEVDHDLMKSAREHCQWMARSQSLVHTGQAVAENIAMGQQHSSEAVRSWMNSPGHRANILNLGHGRIGVAAYCTASGTIFWCQQFRRL